MNFCYLMPGRFDRRLKPHRHLRHDVMDDLNYQLRVIACPVQANSFAPKSTLGDFGWWIANNVAAA
jgi:hypothetical protein